MRVLVRKQQPGEIGSTVGGLAAGVAVTAAESPELIPFAVPIGSEAGRRAEMAIRERVMKDPADLGNLKFFRDAFIRLEGAVRAANSCDYEQMIYDLQLAESNYKNVQDQYASGRLTVDFPPGVSFSGQYARETQAYLDETFDLRRNRLPKILKDNCGCRR